MNKLIFALVASFGVIGSHAPPVHATAAADTAWTGGGLRVAPAPGNQGLVSGIPDGIGGIYLAWEDTRLGGRAIFAQRLSAIGERVAGWPSDGAQICTTSNSAGLPPQLAGDGAGGVIIGWLDDRVGAPSLRDVYAQRVNPSGVAQWDAGGVAVTSTTTAYSCFTMAGDGAGGAAFAWEDKRVAGFTTDHVYAQRLGPLGQRMWAASGVSTNVDTSAGHDQWCPKVVADGAGGTICAWTDLRYGLGHWAVFAQRLDATGTIQWADSGLVIARDICPSTCSGRVWVVPDGSGGAIVVPGTTKAQRVTSTGARLWGPDGVTLPTLPWAVMPDGAGGAFAAYNSPTSHLVYAEHYNAAGTGVWGTPTVCSSTTLATSQGVQGMATDVAGGVLLAWDDRRSGSGGDIYAQRVTAAGTVAAGWPSTGRAVCTVDSLQERPCVVSDGAGGAIMAWVDHRTGVRAIYAARTTADGVVAALVSLVSATAEPDRVLLRWSSSATAGSRVTLYRSVSQDGWNALSDLTADGSGALRYEDLEVTAGGVYHYRLGQIEAGREVFGGEVTVAVPPVLRFGIEPPRPNPSGAELVAAFTLTTAGPARLELIDAAGRVIVAREVGVLGPGRHVLELSSGAKLRPGLYILRLRQGGRSATTRAVVVR